MSLHIIEEASRCLGCTNPQCQQGCPVHTPIPEIIALFKERKVDEAGRRLFENNPLSSVCSLVCNHPAQCEGHCILGRTGNPVHFSAIESYLSDTYLDRMNAHRAPSNGKRIAVIGSGPAGLTVAIKMAQAGCAVTIFELHSRIGGVLEYGIPDFRLPKSYMRRFYARMQDMGVRIRPNTTVGESIYIGDLLRDGYDAVFIGSGAGRAKKLGTPGETRENVYFGVDYLKTPKVCPVGENVAVIGAGNVAMDAARTVLRYGARRVNIYARSRHISANSDEVEYTRLDGGEIVTGKLIQEINDIGPVFKNAIFDENDKVVGYGDELEQTKADTTIICVSQMPKNKLVLTTPGLVPDAQGRLIVDKHCMTTVPGVFAAGDVVLGPKTVVHAVEGSKRAVEGMLRYMHVD
jgi:glutamate synthase (NADPH/NADH) small chain